MKNATEITPMPSAEDRRILRDLAHEVKAIAQSPRQRELKKRWEAHRLLQSEDILITTNIGDAWPALFRLEASADFRNYEWGLRQSIHLNNMGYDNAISDELAIPYVIENTDFGLPVRRAHGSLKNGSDGSYTWEPPIKGPKDLKKLRPGIRVNRDASSARFEIAHELFGDILNLKIQGGYGCQLDNSIAFMRGMEQMMFDIYDDPEFLHELMSFLRNAAIKDYQYMEAEELLGTSADGKPLKLKDGSVSMSSQTFIGISPLMFDEFLFQYQKPILALFYSCSYGCCEPIDDRVDIITQLNNLRRIIVSPWANVELCAEKIKARYIYAWRPHPAQIFCDNWQEEEIRKELQRVSDATKFHGCRHMDVTLQDVTTANGHPERFTEWLKIARQMLL